MSKAKGRTKQKEQHFLYKKWEPVWWEAPDNRYMAIVRGYADSLVNISVFIEPDDIRPVQVEEDALSKRNPRKDSPYRTT